MAHGRSETVNLNASGGFKVTIKSKSGETSPADDISRAASEEGHGASDGGDLQSSVITKPLSPIVSPARDKAADGEGSVPGQRQVVLPTTLRGGCSP